MYITIIPIILAMLSQEPGNFESRLSIAQCAVSCDARNGQALNQHSMDYRVPGLVFEAAPNCMQTFKESNYFNLDTNYNNYEINNYEIFPVIRERNISLIFIPRRLSEVTIDEASPFGFDDTGVPAFQCSIDQILFSSDQDIISYSIAVLPE